MSSLVQHYSKETIESWDYDQFQDWLSAQDEKVQTAFVEAENSPLTFEAYSSADYQSPSFDDFQKIVLFAQLEDVIQTSTQDFQTTQSSRRFAQTPDAYFQTTTVNQDTFLNDEELISYDPFNETLTDAELLPILADETIFSRWLEIHNISSVFEQADGSLLVPNHTDEFYDWFSNSPEFLETPTHIENESIAEGIQRSDQETVTGQTRVFAESITPFYSQAIEHFETEILNDVATDLGIDGVEIPHVLWQAVSSYASIRLAGKPHSHVELGRFLREHLGFTTEETNVGDGDFWDLVVLLNDSLFELERWDETQDFDQFFAQQLQNHPQALSQIASLSNSKFIQRAYDQYESLLEANQEIQSMSSVEDLMAYLSPFQGHVESMDTFYQQLAIDRTWIESAESQYGVRERIPGSARERITRNGDPYVTYSYRTRTPIQPTDCPDHIWELCLEMARVKQDQAFWSSVKQIGAIGVPIGIAVLSMIASGGATTPLAVATIAGIGGAAGVGTAGYFAYDDISRSMDQHQDIQAATAVGHLTALQIGSDEYELLASDALEAAWIRAAVDVPLAGVGVVAGIGIAAKTAHIVKVHNLSRLSGAAVEIGVDGAYGGIEAFISAASDQRNSTAYLVAQDVQAGGDGSQVSGVKAVLYETSIGALFGSGFSAGGRIARGPLESTGRLLSDTITRYRAQGRVREVNGQLQIQKSDSSWIDLDSEAKLRVVFEEGQAQPRVFLEGEDITILHETAERQRASTETITVPRHLTEPSDIPQSILDWGYTRQAQTGNELSIFYNSETRSFTVTDGEHSTTQSVLNGTYARDLQAGETFVAHFHPDKPYPSRQDIELLHARARLEPDKIHRHAIFGFAEDGTPASIDLILSTDQSGRVQTDLESHGPLNPEVVSFFERVAHQIDDDTAAGRVDLSEAAIRQRSEQRAAVAISVSDVRRIQALYPQLDLDPETRSSLDFLVADNDPDWFPIALSDLESTNPDQFTRLMELREQTITLNFQESMRTHLITEGKSNSDRTTTRILDKLTETHLEYETEAKRLLDELIPKYTDDIQHARGLIEASERICQNISDPIARSEAHDLLFRFDNNCFSIIRGRVLGSQRAIRFQLKSSVQSIIENPALSTHQKESEILTLLRSEDAQALLSTIKTNTLQLAVLDLPPIHTRTYAQLQFESTCRSGSEAQQTTLFNLLRSDKTRSDFLGLLHNKKLSEQDLQEFLDLAAKAFSSNNNHPPEYLVKVIQSMIGADHMSGFLFELQLHVDLSRISGAQTSTTDLQARQIPQSARGIRVDSENNVLIPFHFRGRSRQERLDMDLLFSDTPPVEYAEIKSSLNNPSDRQSKQLEKMRTAAQLGYTRLPGCFTHNVRPAKARELINSGYYSYIVQVDQNQRVSVYTADHLNGRGQVTLPNGTLLSTGDFLSDISSPFGGEISLAHFW